MPKSKMLSERIADDILSMITIEKRFLPGAKLPNENELSAELKISRTTLREAIRILVTHEILEIQRGKGTYVTDTSKIRENSVLEEFATVKVNAKDIYEIRLIFEPEAAYYATERATDNELKRILKYGRKVEEKIINGEDRREEEQAFHKSIAKATHNEFMNKLMPIIYQGINKGVTLSIKNEQAVKDTLNDHRMIMEFLEQRNAEGAKTAMKLHILHAMKELDI
ncbi:FadR/GntR family transcriptional regulator [Anaerocolumna sp. AGMB13025]|uniref:FadR/GntR family transcriptional regulator n=1 Tax=Anaerocolumna sp. AGMB13025 TaxID=3039116 RepID=UPI00241DECFD|nr:FadR/GntR family transcriptional regulator [Anaerocolumna sp. AGMB13025]WFR55902.1 FadR/GntR family transcriptional regulator [Anaerocolumna sp. AGMB13025]